MTDDVTATPAEPPPPFRLDQIIDEVRPRDPLAPLENAVVERTLMFPAGSQPSVEVSIEDSPDATTGTAAGTGAFEAKLSIAAPMLGTHALPPPIEAHEVEHDDEHQQQTGGGNQYAEHDELKPKLPDHLGMRPFPRPTPNHLRVPTRTAGAPEPVEGVHEATTIFGGDDRATFYDTTYPWSAMGRVETPGGIASGAMVGPRHMLTVSHTIQWNADGSAGWVKFTPMYYDGSAPFGEAWAVTTYWEGVKVTGPTIDDTEGQHDYVCCVLNSRIGDLTGWIGVKPWSSSWSGSGFWHHVGYPGDLAGTQRPTYQGMIPLYAGDDAHLRLNHQGDVWPGQSGGPYFGYWSDGPYAVCDQSGQTASWNSASGGAHMVDVVLAALRDFP
jgi:V8-like Glu-specific endopeptidase